MGLHILGTLYIPESPYFLIREDKQVLAEEALARLRDPDHDCKSELNEIQVKRGFLNYIYKYIFIIVYLRMYLIKFFV